MLMSLWMGAVTKDAAQSEHKVADASSERAF